MASAMSLAGLVLLTASNVTSSEERPQRRRGGDFVPDVCRYARYRSFSEDVYMNMEEIVTLSVKHNVSDLHCVTPACAMAQTRTHGDCAFTAPDVDRLLLDWLNDAQQYQWRTHGQLDFAVSLSGTRRLRASAFTHQQERRWRYGYCPSVVLIWRKSRRRR